MSGLMPQIPDLLPPDISVEQFRSAMFLELSGRPTLANCTQQSLRDGVIKAAMYGLLPGRDCHLLPFKNRKGGNTQATFVANYFGTLLALERSGKVRKAFAQAVYEHDTFTFDFLQETYSHVPAMIAGKEPGKVLFYYGAVQTTDGAWHVEPMSLKEIDGIRRRAPAHDEGPWVTDFDQMAKKTALKRIAKFVRLTPKVTELFAEDDARQLEDISPERHRQNIVDLFGDGNGGFSHQPTPSIWRQTVEAHYQAMPEDLREQCRAALEDAETTESRGLDSGVCLHRLARPSGARARSGGVMAARWSEEELHRYLNRGPSGMVTEHAWQAAVMRVLRQSGYLAFHVHDSRRSPSGWPDVAAIKPTGGILYLAELKTDSGVVSQAQQAWLHALAQCTEVVSGVWRPNNAQEIFSLLRNGR